MREELEKILKDHSFTAKEREVFFIYLVQLSSLNQEALFLAIKGFPEHLPAFKKLFAEKTDYIKNPTPEKLEAIIQTEQKLMEAAMEKIKQ